MSLTQHYNMASIPFLQRTKQPYLHEGFEKKLSLVSSAFYYRQLLIVSGMPGAGKSSTIFYAVNELDPSAFRICHIELSNPNKKALYKALAVKMGIAAVYNADDIKLQIINFFSEENSQGKFNCVIIDEAHTLSIPMIDELRSFYDEGANFSMVLVGLPSLMTKTMRLSVNLSMKQRISMFVELEPMTLANTKDYILHHLKAVKAKSPIFDEKCFPVIHSVTNGIPRRINQLCYKALVDGFLNMKTIITLEDVKDLVEKYPYVFEGAPALDIDTKQVKLQY